MNWRVVHARAIGTSHAAAALPCQDRERCDVVPDRDGTEVVIGIISDGAGSAAQAERGAELVCDCLFEQARSAIAGVNDLDELGDDIIRTWFVLVREALVQLAREEDRLPGDFNATALLAIVGVQQSICAQVGDGAIVVRMREEDPFRVALWPESGEYSNETTFVTTPFLAEKLEIQRFDCVNDLVMFSDGLQRLALNQERKEPHDAFFRPLVYHVRTTEHPEELEAELESFLSSGRVNDKTDDDKSLIIACRQSL